MPDYRSRTSTHGRNMAGARALWRATGMKDGDFGKPIIAVVNSFTQFVPGHVHLKDMGQLVAREIEAAGGIAKEFNTIAIDDGIAMGHGGMLYSLPSRDLIADSVEYMVNGHCADAMVCISNCDKITPGMLMAAMRLNIPAVFVSGGPMEAGKVTVQGQVIHLDLVDAMVKAVDSSVSDADLAAMLAESYREAGIEVRTDAPVTAVRTVDEGLAVVLADGSAIECDMVVHGAGRTPSLAGLDLDVADERALVAAKGRVGEAGRSARLALQGGHGYRPAQSPPKSRDHQQRQSIETKGELHREPVASGADREAAGPRTIRDGVGVASGAGRRFPGSRPRHQGLAS